LKRLIQKTVSDAAALLILDGRASDGDTIVVDVANGEFSVTVSDLAAA
jgi:ATP-dependent Clp protease ATP-binding subunit ClpA